MTDTKKMENILETSLDVQSFFDAFNVIYQLSKIKDDIYFPCLLGHPVPPPVRILKSSVTFNRFSDLAQIPEILSRTD